MRLRREHRRWLAAAVVALIAAAGAVLALAGSGHPVATASVPALPPVTTAMPPTTTATTPTTTTPVPKKHGPKFLWLLYGYNDARTRVYVGPKRLDGPFRTGWHLGGNAPLEFPPDIDGNALFFMDDHASVNKVNARTGHRYWRKQIGTWSAASPALDPKLKLLFVPVLSKDAESPGDGSFDALSMKTGRTVWSVPDGYGSETSPLVWGKNVYFGDAGGTLFDLDAKTGRRLWSFATGGPIKGGVTLSHGVVYFGNYAGQLFALRASNGSEVWEANVDGHIYASPTVAYGRVYVGSSTSGEMYAFFQRNGALAWELGTGDYVYSSAAVDDTPHLGPTVYFGSYTGTAYAVNALNGRVDWTQGLGDAISGAASIINDVVYFSGVYDSFSRGYNVTTGRPVFYFDNGAYTTMVASPRALYLSGHYVLYELLPKRRRR